MKAEQGIPLRHTVKKINNDFCYICIHVPAVYVDTLHQEISKTQQDHVDTYGFKQHATPLSYIQEHYKNIILEHITEFFFKYFIINFLYDVIQTEKIAHVGEPRLQDIMIEPGKEALFQFEVSLAKKIEFLEWKNFLFKAPKRKNYKDIDRQVESFIKEEDTHRSNYTHEESADIGDWLCCDIHVLIKDQPFCELPKTIWIKIGNEEADIPFQELFLHKKVGDRFTTNDSSLQEYFSCNIPTDYTFYITIIEIVPAAYFSFEDFKHHFRLKSQKDLHLKLIEIFSFRNDMSQRRNIIEEALKLLIAKHHIEVPHHVLLRQQKLVLEMVQHNPDYQVYKMQPNFKENIRLLAQKQAREIILLDQLAYKENINVTTKDIRGYLNLLKRQRTKEFVYFNPPPTKIDGQEMPIPAALLKTCCLREKTLNYMIYHLTRK